MKAISCTKYGPPEVLKLVDIQKPTPQKGELRIKIHATSATSSDCVVRGFKIPKWNPLRILMGMVLGFGKPRNPILGMVASGEVEAIGEGVEKFSVGDKVFFESVKSPTKMKFGTYAQYFTIPEDWLIAHNPKNASFEEAAALPYGGDLALHFLHKGNIKNCKKVLIIGASGAVGTAAVQLATYYGAEVTGVCSGANRELVLSLGAKKVIDYTKEEYALSSEKYDLILYAVPHIVKDKNSPRKLAKSILAPGGKFISTHNGSPTPTMENMLLLKRLFEEGKFKPVIDRTYPLEEMVSAHEHIEKGHKKGNVIITIE